MVIVIAMTRVRWVVTADATVETTVLPASSRGSAMILLGRICMQLGDALSLSFDVVYIYD